MAAASSVRPSGATRSSGEALIGVHIARLSLERGRIQRCCFFEAAAR